MSALVVRDDEAPGAQVEEEVFLEVRLGEVAVTRGDGALLDGLGGGVRADGGEAAAGEGEGDLVAGVLDGVVDFHEELRWQSADW